ncbi:MAG TPA: DUF454 domain-containing protein [Firmicutes bacterium]|nr:DUF454 domain-containing protein [Bacillota bacterium]
MSVRGKIKKALLIAGGSLALGLGVIGIFLPVLPTTPFLLLAAYCYIRSSQKLYSWLINHRIFGTYIYSYLTYGAITRSTRTGALILLWSTLLLSSIFIPVWILKLVLLAVGIGVTVHLIKLKTVTVEEGKTVIRTGRS